MESHNEIKKLKSPNKLRTKLLILANHEINKIKKTNYTQINSKSLNEFEKFYSDLNNNNAIELKEEKFVSRDFTDIIQQNIIREKFTLESPDGNNLKFNCLYKENASENNNIFKLSAEKNNKNFAEKKVVFLENLGIENKKALNIVDDSFKLSEYNKKKSLISSKKNMFFKMNTLRKQTNSWSEDENNNVIAAPKISKIFFKLTNLIIIYYLS
jgi:hypothetical protein